MMLKSLKPLARLIACAAALAAAPAQAEDWWFVSSSRDIIILIDVDSVRGDASRRTADVLDYRAPSDQTPITGEQIEVDCRGIRIRYIESRIYDLRVNVTERQTVPESDNGFRDVPPGSHAESMVRFICGDEAYRLSEEAEALRVGVLRRHPDDVVMLFRLTGAGVRRIIATPFALGRIGREAGEAVLRLVNPEEAATLRANGFPR